MKASIIFNQIRYDLIGKDSQRGITLSYGWLANQLGHISLGFIPGIMCVLFTNYSFLGMSHVVAAGLTSSFLFTLFEVYNFTEPLLVGRKKSAFEPDWKNVGFDTFTDVVFFYIGGLWAVLATKHLDPQSVSIVPTIAFIVCWCYVAAVFTYWYTTKIYLQSANFPFQSRISQWNFEIGAKNHDTLYNIVKSQPTDHIIIIGKQGSGKTQLGVSLATEYAIKHKKVFYTTMNKFAAYLQHDDKSIANDYNLWTWRESECVVIDDINVGLPVPDVFSIDFVKSLINSPETSDFNHKALLSQTVIWIVGADNIDSQIDDWKNMILGLGIADEHIKIIDLSADI